MPAKKTKKKAARGKYVCFDCGSLVTLDRCGVGFKRLVCCGKVMKKKSKKKPTKKK